MKEIPAWIFIEGENNQKPIVLPQPITIQKTLASSNAT
jgi:hypothetical protein